MKRYLGVLVALGLVLSIASAALAANGQVSVISNVLAESITRDRGGSARINRQILGFKAGTVASFQSLTTFMVPQPGFYSYRIEIIGPDNQTRAFYSDFMETKQPNWTQQQVTQWNNVEFNAVGMYRFVVDVNAVKITEFPIFATK